MSHVHPRSGSALASRYVVVAALVVALVTAPCAPAFGQSASKRHYVAINPVILLLADVGVEGERRITDAVTIGIAATYWDEKRNRASDAATIGQKDTYLTTEGKLRVYPDGRAFAGMSLAATAGFTRARERWPRAPANDTSAHAWSYGLEADVNFMVGTRRRILLGIGFGLKRMNWSAEMPAGTPKAADIWPTLRMVTGYTFEP